MARYQRWNALLDLLPGDGELTVAEAAGALGVSAATIRRDLDQLVKQQLVTRTRGGATAGHVSYDLPLRYKTARHAPEKQRIGRAAAALLAPGASVALNGGTTTSEVARALATRPDLQDGDGTPAVTVRETGSKPSWVTARRYSPAAIPGNSNRPCASVKTVETESRVTTARATAPDRKSVV